MNPSHLLILSLLCGWLRCVCWGEQSYASTSLLSFSSHSSLFTELDLNLNSEICHITEATDALTAVSMRLQAKSNSKETSTDFCVQMKSIFFLSCAVVHLWCIQPSYLIKDKVTQILVFFRHFGAQRGEVFHLMLSASHRERVATVRHCLALIDSSCSGAADTDRAVHPGVWPSWLPWCLKYAFVTKRQEFDTRVSKLHPSPLRGWALAGGWRCISCHTFFFF